MYHSVIFKNASGTMRNTWDDWQLIPTIKPTFPMPEFQGKFVDVPGKSGSIDMSTYLTNELVYADRTASFSFYALDTAEDWDIRCQEIAKYLHGQKLRIILEDDPLYYYEGRVMLKEKKTDGQFPMITFDFRVGPYKKHINTGATAF